MDIICKDGANNCEIWKDIPLYKGYQVSNLGKVRSFWGREKGHQASHLCESPKILSEFKAGSSIKYLCVKLYNDSCKINKKNRKLAKHFYMHRLVYECFKGSIPKDRQIDHINNNSLDNRIENLRIATPGQNGRNSKSKKGCSSSYRGVRRVPRKLPWRAELKAANRNIWLGNFSTEKEAALAYDLAACRYLPKEDLSFVKFNFPKDLPRCH